MLYLQKLPLRWLHLSGPGLAVLLCIVTYLLEPLSAQHLAYDVNQLPWAEPWRWLSANFVHTNGIHLLLNVAGLSMLWLLHGHYYTHQNFVLQLFFYSGCVTLSMYVFAPQMQWYVGLSGVLHGIFVWGAMQDIRHRQFGGKLLLLGVWVKIAYEQWTGGSKEVADMIGANVAVDAHLYGALGGLVFGTTALAMAHRRALAP